MKIVLVIYLCVSLLNGVLANRAFAESSGGGSIYFQPYLGTEFPLGWTAGGRVQLAQYPIYLRGGMGGFIGAYTDAMNSIAESMGFYDSNTSTLVKESLDGATFTELGVGYANASGEGWLFELAYNKSVGEGQVTGQELLTAITGISVGSASNEYSIDGEIESYKLTAGYAWTIEGSWKFLLSGGLIKPFTSKTNIDRPTSGPVQEAILQAANRDVDDYMNDVYTQDVIIPFIGATVGYGF
ncbi:MAG: hypothetical protein CL677_10475 [Bdellovibrionaceae bacterium]|nr:hypothetical protein [Pseudobdellovibrionaceae bacterium]|tara:strand:- start:182557 stop:183279 length:723 start_codon:yes stop_codon:yes gene_type:complete